VNALRLAFGTLSLYPVRPPESVDRQVAGWAMAAAPLVGICLALPLWVVSELADRHWSPLLLGAVWLAGLAVLTRAMHLDGLADTADGLGSRKAPEEALELMRKGDIGPFGVAAVVLALLLQLGAAAQLLTTTSGPALLAVAVVVSRLVVPLVCSPRVPSARDQGLGATVAGSVGTPQAVTSVLATVLLTVGISAVDLGATEPVMLSALGLVAGLAFCGWCVRRLGGVTGDVIGACVEVTFTGCLLAMAFG
jgi:adenosylcobinamide-GDP ribazoletransferase